MLNTIAMLILAAATATDVAAQAPPPDSPPAQVESRQAAIERQQAAKVPTLHPYAAGEARKIFTRVGAFFEARGPRRWHPFLESAYAGGGFTLGAGRTVYLGPYNLIDARASYSIDGYKRAEVEYLAPRLFDRRARLSVIGGWREATAVGFWGLGIDTSEDDRTNYLFNRPCGNALLTYYPTRKFLVMTGGVEFTQWSQGPGKGSFPSVETQYTPGPSGLNADVTYLHTEGGVGFDWRPSPSYARRGGFYGAALHDYHDRDDAFGFQILEYEAIQHVPILRETWALSFHALVQSAREKAGQQTPFFMLPALGGGSTLRGYHSWRFRDTNSLLLQAEWRIMVNRFLDMAFFYDTGKVAARMSDLDLNDLRDDYGIGARFHGPAATLLRLELARGREGFAFVFSSHAPF